MSSEELKKDQELRTAMRNAHWPFPRILGADEWGSRVGMTGEEYINTEIDNRIDGGEGEIFKLFRAKYGRYPEHGETRQALGEFYKHPREEEETKRS